MLFRAFSLFLFSFIFFRSSLFSFVQFYILPISFFNRLEDYRLSFIYIIVCFMVSTYAKKVTIIGSFISLFWLLLYIHFYLLEVLLAHKHCAETVIAPADSFIVFKPENTSIITISPSTSAHRERIIRVQEEGVVFVPTRMISISSS